MNTQIEQSAQITKQFATFKHANGVQIDAVTMESMLLAVEFKGSLENVVISDPANTERKVSELRKSLRDQGIGGVAVNKVINAYMTHPIRKVAFDAVVSKARNNSDIAFSHTETTKSGIHKLVCIPLAKEGKAKTKTAKSKPVVNLTLLPSGTQWKDQNGNVYTATEFASLQATHDVKFIA